MSKLEQSKGGKYWYCNICEEHLNSTKNATATAHALGHKTDTKTIQSTRQIKRYDSE